MRQTARIIQEFDEEFKTKLPAFTVELISSNPNITVEINEQTCFSVKFSLINNTSNHQLVSGSAGDLKENLFVFGKTLHEGATSRVSKNIGGNRSNTIEVNSRWIQDKGAAEKVADWISNRLSREKLTVSLSLMGTPVLEVGDIIAAYHHDLKMTHRKEFIINSVSLQWDSGLQTDISAVEL